MSKLIAVDCREFRRGAVTGIGRLLANFLTHAARTRRDLNFLLLCAQDTELPFAVPDNAAVERLYEVNTQLWEQVQVPVALKRRGCALYFSPYSKTCLFSAVPAVTTIHDLTWAIYPGYASGAWLRRMLDRKYSAKASAVLTDSVNSKGDIVRILGLDPRKVYVCHGSVDSAVFSRMPDEEALKLKYGITGRYLLYVGNANPHKNLGGLVRAYAALPPELRKEYALVLAGVGGYRPGPVSGPGACVTIGRVPDADLPKLYSGAAVFVFPSFYEGFGLPPLEAMACGCPVVSSGAACLPEILGDACAYFDPSRPEEMAGAVSAVLRDPGLRAELIGKGLERVRLYGPDRACEAILRVFDTVLG